jgi:DNA-binding transcriptional regulator GbsR (MarR family)
MIPNNSSKFYSKSLTLLPSILQMINDGLIATEIAKILGMEKPHLSYYTKKLIDIGLCQRKWTRCS